MVILGATGAFARLGGGEFLDNLVDVVGVAFHRAGDRPAAEGAEAVAVAESMFA